MISSFWSWLSPTRLSAIGAGDEDTGLDCGGVSSSRRCDDLNFLIRRFRTSGSTGTRSGCFDSSSRLRFGATSIGSSPIIKKNKDNFYLFPPNMSSRRTRRQAEPHKDYGDYDENHFDDDDSLEEVTRCICGKDELIIPDNAGTEFDDVDTGFFIQCESCSVWQHGYCVGIIDEDTAPEKYWCESCRPEHHDLFTDKYGFRRSRYNPYQEIKRNKRRLQERAAAESPAPVASAPVSVESGSGTPPTSVATTPPRMEVKREKSAEESEKRKRARGTLNSRDAEYEQMLKRALEESAKESGVQPDEVNLSSSNESASRETRSRKKVKDEPSQDEEASPTNTSQPQKLTPPTSASSSTSASTKKSKKKKEEPQDKKKQPKIELAEDKPFKANLPSQRISMNEMKRRVFSIMEFVSNIQTELTNEEDFKHSLLNYTSEDSTEETLRLQKVLIDCYNESVTQLDSLTEKLNPIGLDQGIVLGIQLVAEQLHQHLFQSRAVLHVYVAVAVVGEADPVDHVAHGGVGHFFKNGVVVVLETLCHAAVLQQCLYELQFVGREPCLLQLSCESGQLARCVSFVSQGVEREKLELCVFVERRQRLAVLELSIEQQVFQLGQVCAGVVVCGQRLFEFAHLPESELVDFLVNLGGEEHVLGQVDGCFLELWVVFQEELHVLDGADVGAGFRFRFVCFNELLQTFRQIAKVEIHGFFVELVCLLVDHQFFKLFRHIGHLGHVDGVVADSQQLVDHGLLGAHLGVGLVPDDGLVFEREQHGHEALQRLVKGGLVPRVMDQGAVWGEFLRHCEQRAVDHEIVLEHFDDFGDHLQVVRLCESFQVRTGHRIGEIDGVIFVVWVGYFLGQVADGG
ncbi:hypothetical protein OGAPHI_000703 [Ogataea philodendri]|uniref:Zinc finger PHD-type domain-containing protein n=1 Tax=Ogataea philodendri TaxID=1378263 RepID=A0A9P8PGS7_9ASCO|nr:uncharacterized protein OGAPHI_000703 [Ogataea philodendri]KAH3670992.1 hypothetical protein OGAPHI_000703 [Ogataea philodendri]